MRPLAEGRRDVRLCCFLWRILCVSCAVLCGEGPFTALKDKAAGKVEVGDHAACCADSKRYGGVMPCEWGQGIETKNSPAIKQKTYAIGA